jgi:glycosyltransferase involved in cell wall biosynthesis
VNIVERNVPTQSPQLAVVIPVYNKAAYVRRAVDSALAQTYCDFELIVVDDGSTDDSAAIVSSYSDPRIRLLRQANVGVSLARNRGVAEAQSAWVAFLDADDQWQPGFLAAIAELVHEHPDAGLAGTAYQYSDQPGACPGAQMLIDRGFNRGILENYFEIAPHGLPFYTSSVAVRREAFLSVGGFRPVWGGEDPDLWLRLAIRYPVAYSTAVQVIYHRGMPTQYSSMNLMPPYPPAAVSVRELDGQGKIPARLRNDVLEYRNRLLIWHADALVTGGRRREAKAVLAECRGTQRYRKLWRRHCLRASLPAWVLGLVWKPHRNR